MRSIRALGLLALLGTAVYSNTFRSSFHFDDHGAILWNSRIRHLDLAAVLDAFNTRFLTGLSFALNYWIGGYDVTGYHVFNVAVHLSAAAAVYALFILTARTPLLTGRIRHVQAASMVAAVIFVAHPIQTQAVTYIWQRSASMAGLFYLSSMVFYVLWRLEGSKAAYLASLLSAVAAMFTKEISLTLPLAITLYEWVFFTNKSRRPISTLVPFWLCLSIIPLMLLREPSIRIDLMRPSASPSEITRWVGESAMSATHYWCTQLNVFRTYLRLLVWPAGQNLDYDYPIAKSLLDPGVMISIALITGLLTTAIVARKRRPLISFCILWFFLSLSVEAFVVQNDVIYEHRLYLPMAAFCLFIASVLDEVLRREHLLKAAALILGLTLGTSAFLRNSVWKDEITLWQDVIVKSPGKARPYANLAYAYSQDPSRRVEAMPMIKKALQLDPRQALAHLNLGVENYHLGKKEEAAASWKKALELDPELVMAYGNLANVYSELGRDNEAITLCEKGLAVDPYSAELYVTMGSSKIQTGRYAEAVKDFEHAIELDARQAEAFNSLGIAYSKLGMKEQARTAFHKALALDPISIEIKSNIEELKIT